MIKINNVSKSFVVKDHSKKLFRKSKKNTKNVISNLNLEIPKGKIIGLLGINGAGKTTTIKMLSTLLSPTTGEILIDGNNILDDLDSYKQKINLISGGEKNLFWRLTGRENLEYFSSLYGIKSSESDLIIDKVLKLVGLSEAADVVVEKYSKGMKQRLQIAKGLINNPDYIFLDEPTLGLDVLIAKELRNYIKKLSHEENKGILLTSHYLHEVEELCDYIYILESGRVKIEGTPEQVISNLSKVIKTTVIFNKKIKLDIEKIQEIESVKTVEYRNDDMLQIVSENEVISNFLKTIGLENVSSIQSISSQKPTLEDSLILSMEENV